jgi:Flp pilus assembly protein TadD
MVGPDQPFRHLATLRAAMALDRADRKDEAEAAFKEAIRRDPEDLQAQIAYGNMLRSRERFDDAAEVYSDVIEKLPEPDRGDWTIFYFRGIAYEQTDRWELAEKDFQKALELFPDQPLVLNYLGYSWVDKGIHLDEAMAMIRTAVRLRPDDGFIVDSLGWAHYRLGEYEEAVRELERAIELQPDDPILNDHLGDAYWKLGRKLEAQFQWRHARDLGAKPPELEIILRKIAEGELVEKASLEPDVYIVRPGDTLWTISADLLDSGEAYRRLFDANRDQLRDPDDLQPGMQLKVPMLTVNAAYA